jgi:hypothetical protein
VKEAKKERHNLLVFQASSWLLNELALYGHIFVAVPR